MIHFSLHTWIEQLLVEARPCHLTRRHIRRAATAAAAISEASIVFGTSPGSVSIATWRPIGHATLTERASTIVHGARHYVWGAGEHPALHILIASVAHLSGAAVELGSFVFGVVLGQRDDRRLLQSASMR